MNQLIKNTLAIGSLCWIFSSCHEVLFRNPQPVDARNESKIPGKFRGTWIDNGDTVIIDSYSYLHINYLEEELSIRAIDSLKYTIRDGFIYVQEVDEVGFGKIIAQNDSVIKVQIRKTDEIRLGEHNILRRAGEDYVLSTRNENDEQWWQLSLITQNENKDVLIKYLSEDDLELIDKKHLVFKDENDTYLDVQWKTDEMKDLIKAGLFSDTLLFLEKTHKIK